MRPRMSGWMSGSKRTKSADSSVSTARNVRSLGSPDPAPTKVTRPIIFTVLLLLRCARRDTRADDLQVRRRDGRDGVVSGAPSRDSRGRAWGMKHVEVPAPKGESPSGSLIDLVEAALAEHFGGLRVD